MFVFIIYGKIVIYPIMIGERVPIRVATIRDNIFVNEKRKFTYEKPTNCVYS